MILSPKTMQTLLLGPVTANWYYATLCGHHNSFLILGEQYIPRFHNIYWADCGSFKDPTEKQIYPQEAIGIRTRIGIGTVISIGIGVGIGMVLFCYWLPPMPSLSGVIQTSGNNPHSFQVKIHGVRDSFQLLNIKEDVEFQIAFKWQLALLQGFIWSVVFIATLNLLTLFRH